MSQTKIKICGLYREVDINYVNQYQPDYGGFIFYPPPAIEMLPWNRQKAERKIRQKNPGGGSLCGRTKRENYSLCRKWVY